VKKDEPSQNTIVSIAHFCPVGTNFDIMACFLTYHVFEISFYLFDQERITAPAEACSLRMRFTRFQKNWDLKILKKLTNFETVKSLILELNNYAFTMARQPVKTRMDFVVVQRRLNRDEYSLVPDWIC
jgi:hypothetical protein